MTRLCPPFDLISCLLLWLTRLWPHSRPPQRTWCLEPSSPPQTHSSSLTLVRSLVQCHFSLRPLLTTLSEIETHATPPILPTCFLALLFSIALIFGYEPGTACVHLLHPAGRVNLAMKYP